MQGMEQGRLARTENEGGGTLELLDTVNLPEYTCIGRT